MTTLWILTEEGPNKTLANAIKVYDPTLKIDESKFRFKRKRMAGKLVWKITGLTSDKYSHFRVCVVSSASGSFCDVLFFEGKQLPVEDSKPIAAVEITKNNGAEAGNMHAQRAAKFVPLCEKYGSIPCFYLIINRASIEKTKSTWSQTHNCDFAAMAGLGTKVFLAQRGKIGVEKYEPPFKYGKNEDVASEEGKKQKRAGVPMRLGITNESIRIQANLRKKTGRNDPAEGYVASRAALARKFDPDVRIVIAHHGREELWFRGKDNKLINVLKYMGNVTIEFPDGHQLDIPRDSSVFNKPYWKYCTTGEKLSSISLEVELINRGNKLIFTNHAGCEKTDINIGGKTYVSKKEKGIPDLVLYNEEEHKLLVIEAETHANYKKGLKQVRDPAFMDWINKNCLSHYQSPPEAVVALCTYGKLDKRPGVCFSIDENMNFHYELSERVIL